MVTEHSNLEMRTITEPVYEWKDHSRYVEVIPVQTGWLTVWGKYEDLGETKHVHGTRTYRDIAGVRRRIADVILDFTRKPSEVRDALMLFDRQGGLPAHKPKALAEPL
ncbi:MAG: hypothetical protein ACR2OO_03195 [Thermomicrobiales bacterium]